MKILKYNISGKLKGSLMLQALENGQTVYIYMYMYFISIYETFTRNNKSAY